MLCILMIHQVPYDTSTKRISGMRGKCTTPRCASIIALYALSLQNKQGTSLNGNRRTLQVFSNSLSHQVRMSIFCHYALYKVIP